MSSKESAVDSNGCCSEIKKKVMTGGKNMPSTAQFASTEREEKKARVNEEHGYQGNEMEISTALATLSQLLRDVFKKGKFLEILLEFSDLIISNVINDESSISFSNEFKKYFRAEEEGWSRFLEAVLNAPYISNFAQDSKLVIFLSRCKKWVLSQQECEAEMTGGTHSSSFTRKHLDILEDMMRLFKTITIYLTGTQFSNTINISGVEPFLQNAYYISHQKVSEHVGIGLTPKKLASFSSSELLDKFLTDNMFHQDVSRSFFSYDDEGRSLLMHAVSMHLTDYCKKLLSHAKRYRQNIQNAITKKNTKNNNNNSFHLIPHQDIFERNVFHYIAFLPTPDLSFHLSRKMDLLRLFLDYSINLKDDNAIKNVLNQQDKFGCTPLHYACATVPFYTPFVSELIGKGASNSINVCDIEGNFPINYAVMAMQHTEFLQELLEMKGASITGPLTSNFQKISRNKLALFTYLIPKQKENLLIAFQNALRYQYSQELLISSFLNSSLLLEHAITGIEAKKERLKEKRGDQYSEEEEVITDIQPIYKHLDDCLSLFTGIAFKKAIELNDIEILNLLSPITLWDHKYLFPLTIFHCSYQFISILLSKLKVGEDITRKRVRRLSVLRMSIPSEFSQNKRKYEGSLSHFATLFKRKDLFKLVHQYGDTFKVMDSEHLSSVAYLLKLSFFPKLVVEKLKGVIDVNAPCNSSNDTILHLAGRYPDPITRKEWVRNILDCFHGEVNLQTTNNNEQCVLNIAFELEDEEFCKLLLDYERDNETLRANPNVLYKGQTVLLNTIRKKNIRLYDLLMTSYRDRILPNIVSSQGECALYAAVCTGLPEFVRPLIDDENNQIANPNIQNMDGFACIHKASEISSDMIKILRECQNPPVNCNIVNYEGLTPLAMAVRTNNLPAVKELTLDSSIDIAGIAGSAVLFKEARYAYDAADLLLNTLDAAVEAKKDAIVKSKNDFTAHDFQQQVATVVEDSQAILELSRNDLETIKNISLKVAHLRSTMNESSSSFVEIANTIQETMKPVSSITNGIIQKQWSLQDNLNKLVTTSPDHPEDLINNENDNDNTVQARDLTSKAFFDKIHSIAETVSLLDEVPTHFSEAKKTALQTALEAIQQCEIAIQYARESLESTTLLLDKIQHEYFEAVKKSDAIKQVATNSIAKAQQLALSIHKVAAICEERVKDLRDLAVFRFIENQVKIYEPKGIKVLSKEAQKAGEFILSLYASSNPDEAETLVTECTTNPPTFSLCEFDNILCMASFLIQTVYSFLEQLGIDKRVYNEKGVEPIISDCLEDGVVFPEDMIQLFKFSFEIQQVELFINGMLSCLHRKHGVKPIVEKLFPLSTSPDKYHCASTPSHKGCSKLARLLLDLKEITQCFTFLPPSPLHIALNQEYFDIVKFLIEKDKAKNGADFINTFYWAEFEKNPFDPVKALHYFSVFPPANNLFGSFMPDFIRIIEGVTSLVQITLVEIKQYKYENNEEEQKQIQYLNKRFRPELWVSIPEFEKIKAFQSIRKENTVLLHEVVPDILLRKEAKTNSHIRVKLCHSLGIDKDMEILNGNLYFDFNLLFGSGGDTTFCQLVDLFELRKTSGNTSHSQSRFHMTSKTESKVEINNELDDAHIEEHDTHDENSNNPFLAYNELLNELNFTLPSDVFILRVYYDLAPENIKKMEFHYKSDISLDILKSRCLNLFDFDDTTMKHDRIRCFIGEQELTAVDSINNSSSLLQPSLNYGDIISFTLISSIQLNDENNSTEDQKQYLEATSVSVKSEVMHKKLAELSFSPGPRCCALITVKFLNPTIFHDTIKTFFTHYPNQLQDPNLLSDVLFVGLRNSSLETQVAAASWLLSNGCVVSRQLFDKAAKGDLAKPLVSLIMESVEDSDSLPNAEIRRREIAKARDVSKPPESDNFTQ